MINSTPQLGQSNGDLNYLIIEYLKSISFNDNDQKAQLIKKLTENLSFGNIIDVNLVPHNSSYDLRGQILRHLNTANLLQIVNQYFTSKPIENERFYTEEVDPEKNRKDYPNKKSLMSFNKNKLFYQNQKLCDFLDIHQKNSSFNYSKNVRDAFEYRTIINYSHMKTILGHVQMDDNLLISPVPIFCMCFSEDGEFIFTGDNIGTIKIWSTLTGGIIETFRLFSEKEEKSAINDLLEFNNCLVVSSEDKNIVIWNIKTFQICGKFSFDEGLLNINGYKYVYQGTTLYLLIVGAESGNMYFIDMNINQSTDEDYKNIFPIRFYIDKTIHDSYNLYKTKSLELSGMSSDDSNGLLVSGFHNGLVCIWDTIRILNAAIQKKETLHNFSQYAFYAQLCHKTTVQLVEFSPDKTHFLTGSLDGTVLVWRIFPELIATIRKDYYLKKDINLINKIPVSNIFIICESEDRIKCSVNVATWTKKNNYIIAMISSKPRKKHRNDYEIDIDEDINNKKKKSSLIVYSLKSNKIIHKYNENSGIKGLNFIDGNYIFGCHPLFEEIIFTLNGTRNIILFNVKTGEIIQRFKQNDIFFESDKKTPLSCEGMFSNKGDYFAITAYSGTLSIFSIYTKNSYSATYMNQFYSKEFDPNLQQVNTNINVNGVPSLSSIFPKPVNMYNLPYIIEQPYSSFKLEQINNNKKLLNTKYCLNDKEIKHKFLASNLITYEKNFDERVLECQKEEEAYYNAEKDNMNYRINRINDEIERISEDNFSQYESYDENDFYSNYNNIGNDNRNNSFICEENNIEIEEDYNDELSRDDLRELRTGNDQTRRTSRRYNLRYNVRNSSRSNSRNRNIISIDDNNASNNKENNDTNNVRNYSLRNRNEISNINNDIPNININDNNNHSNSKINTNLNEFSVYNNYSRKKSHVINDDEDEENCVGKNKEKNKKFKQKDDKEQNENVIIGNKRKKDDDIKDKEKRRDKERGKNKRNKKEDDEDEEYKDVPVRNTPKKKKKKLKKRGRPKKAKNHDLMDDEEENYNESDYDSDSEDNKEAMKGLEAEESEDSEGVKDVSENQDYIGIDDDDDKNGSCEEVSENKYEFKNESNPPKNKYQKLLAEKLTHDNQSHTCFFCHQVFMGEEDEATKIYGPFYYNERTDKISPSKSSSNTKEIYIDFNCLEENNDFFDEIKKDNNCSPASVIEEVIKQNKICFRCGSPFATKKCYSCRKVFHGNLCLTQMTDIYQGQSYCLECLKKKYVNFIEENMKPNKKINYESIDKNYFLCNKIFNSKYYPQLGEEVYFILHAYLQFLGDKYEYILYEIEDKQRIFWWADNSYKEKYSHFNFYKPFICKVTKIDFCFPNNKTLVLIKDKNESDELNKNLKILVKLQLEIVELDNTEINIILFDNDNPDFLVRKNIYEETLKYYKEFILPKKIKNLKVNLSEDIIKVTLTDNKPEENNTNLGKSKFNSLKVVSESEKDEQKYSFWDVCINNNHNKIITKKMKYIMDGLYDTINRLCEKSEVPITFYDMITEDKAPNYFQKIPVPMFIKLIVERLINKYYITEDSIKFDIQLLVDNAKKYSGVNSGTAKDSEKLKKRLIDEIKKLSNEYEENLNGTHNDSDSDKNYDNDNDNDNELNTKKLNGKKRKRDVDNDSFNLDDNESSEEYHYGSHKKRELMGNNRVNNINNINRNNNSYNNISINISINKNVPSIKKKVKKKRI